MEHFQFIGLMFVVTCPAITISGNELYGDACYKDADCDSSSQLICNKEYFGGCAQGFCSCTPGKTWDNIVRKCKTVRKPDDFCDRDADLCSGTSTCRDGICVCPVGMSSLKDNDFCLPTFHTKLLGEKCHLSDVCYHFSGGTFSTSLADCVNYRCQCRKGYSQDGLDCRAKWVGESGCTTDSCIYGATCREGTCQCSSGRLPVSAGSVCISKSAAFALGVGEVCDNTANNPNPMKVCRKDLSCSRCPGSAASTCIKFSSDLSDPVTDGKYNVHKSTQTSSSPVHPSISYCLLIPFAIAGVIL